MTQRIVHVFAGDHPTAPGHFPGNPIIPGACILREVMAAVRSAMGADVLSVQTVKFLRPVRPGDAVALEWRAGEDGAVRFACVLDVGGETVVTGAMRMCPP